MGWTTITVAFMSIGALIWLLKRRGRNSAKGMLHRPNWVRDRVYLVQFPVSPHVRSISPFSLKLETYLRMKGIPYENVHSLVFSRKGQIPYIELNGEQIADSNCIIHKLEEVFGSGGKELSKEQKALAHAITVMVENHTALAGFYWRYGFNMEEFYAKLVEPNFTGKGLFFFRYFQPYAMRLKTSMHGLGRHSLEEVATFSNRDLQAISDLLGDKKFFFDDQQPSTLDCTLYGHLIQFLYIPMEFPQKAFMKKRCSNLLEYVDRIRDTLWPDWLDMCTADCMSGKMGIQS